MKTLQKTFKKITNLFITISCIILAICIFIVIILLMKLQQTRQKMIKLLSAFGFKKKMISNMVVCENVLLAINIAIITIAFGLVWQILI